MRGKSSRQDLQLQKGHLEDESGGNVGIAKGLTGLLSQKDRLDLINEVARA